MATVRMKKGNKFADIFASPETIAQAKSEGYEIFSETETKEVKTEKNDTSEAKSAGKSKK